MKKAVLFIVFLFLAPAPTVLAGSGAHWSYSGHRGPEHWGELADAYKMCALGKNQSPIDLTGFIEAELPPLSLTYGAGASEILNNGHSVQVNYKGGSTLEIEGRAFELKQFHFHAPSENRIEGKSFPMEVHLVHADKDGNLAVIAVMVEEGEANGLLASLWKDMPRHEGDRSALSGGLNVMSLLPKDKDYYRFNGSLTTPPCSEGVFWVVMKEPVTASPEQIKEFEEVMHHPNNRPLQPKNARVILK
jgi:carbonic anhydrase